MPEPQWTDFEPQDMEDYWWQENQSNASTPPWLSDSDVGVGVSTQERLQLEQAERDEAYQFLSGLVGDSPEGIRDYALANDEWSEGQRKYLGDVPTRYEEMEWGGLANPRDIAINQAYSSMPAAAVDIMQHELRHQWQLNMLSPRERVDWLDKYNLAVMENRMEPEPERFYFNDEPNARALEAYARRPRDLPYDMNRFYDTPITPMSQWPVPKWRRTFDPSRAR